MIEDITEPTLTGRGSRQGKMIAPLLVFRLSPLDREAGRFEASASRATRTSEEHGCG